MTVLAVDLALASGWAVGRILSSERILRVAVPKQGKLANGQAIEVRTRVEVVEAGLIRFPDVPGRMTATKEAKRLADGLEQLKRLIQATRPDVLVFESAAKTAWLRERRRTGASMATTGALRAVLLLAAWQMGVQEVVEIAPETWQNETIGRGKRELQKSKSIESALWRYGCAVGDDNIADAINLCGYWLTVNRGGR